MGKDGWFFRKNASRNEKIYTCYFVFLILLLIYGMGMLSFHSTKETALLSWLPALPLAIVLLVPLYRDKQMKANLQAKKPFARIVFWPMLTGLICLLSFLTFERAIPSIYTRLYGTDTTVVAQLKHKGKTQSKTGGIRCYDFYLQIPHNDKNAHKCVDEDVWEKVRPGDRFEVKLRSSHFGFLIGNIEL